MKTNIYDINLNFLNQALNFYSLRGYKMISAPLVVDHDVIEETLPKGCYPKRHKGDKFYVGSGEQSFYQLMNEYEQAEQPITNGSFMLLTPCQRDEEIIDESHLEIFLKLELISLDKNPLYDAIDFHKTLKTDYDTIYLRISSADPDITDIEINGIEVGSYGSRFYQGQNVYNGTGLALPRISFALSKTVEIE